MDNVRLVFILEENLALETKVFFVPSCKHLCVVFFPCHQSTRIMFS